MALAKSGASACLGRLPQWAGSIHLGRTAKRQRGLPRRRCHALRREPSPTTDNRRQRRAGTGGVAKRRLTRARTAVLCRSARAAALDQCRPRVGPLMMQNSGPTGICRRGSSHGCSSSQPQASMPTSRRRPPLPRRTNTGRSRGGASDDAHGRRAHSRRLRARVIAADGCSCTCLIATSTVLKLPPIGSSHARGRA